MKNNLTAPSASELATWLGRLIQIPSVNPAQAGGDTVVAGEFRLATALADWFRQFGGDVYRDEVLPNRPNVYAIWWGTGDLWRAVDIHMDTVSVSQMTAPPFSGELAEGKVHGRGACDTKATLGILLAILEKLHLSQTRLDFNLLISATVDEEVGMAGAEGFARWLPQQGIVLDELLIAEPTLCKPAIGHKGDIRLIFTVHGQAAHSSQPEQGKNAITAAARLITALEAEHQRMQALPAQSVLGHAKLTVTLISGGTGLNVVPDSCQVSADRRTLPGENAAGIEEHLLQLADRECPLPVSLEKATPSNAFIQSPDSPWVQSLAAFTATAPITLPYGTNASRYAGLARETVVLGPGSIDQAHGKEEWVAVSQLETMRDILLHWWGLQD